MRLLLALLLTALGAADSATPGLPISPAEKAAVRRLLDLAFAHGLPDPRQGRLLVGHLGLPRKQEGDPPFAETSVHYALHRNHPGHQRPIHLQDGAGRWWIGLDWRLRAGVVVDASNTVPLLAGGLLPYLERGHRPHPAEEPIWIHRRLASLPPDERAIAIAFWPLLARLCAGTSDPVLPLQLSVLDPAAEDRLLGLVCVVQGLEGSSGDEDAAPLFFGHGSTDDEPDPDAATARLRWRESLLGDDGRQEERVRHLPTPSQAARQALLTWFAWDVDDDLPERRRRSLAALEALAGPEDDRLLAAARLTQARLALPATAARTAPLSLRAALWRPQGDERWSRRPVEVDLLGPEDLDGLMTLLDDPGPSVWHDRCLGDNALRACAFLLGFDPRLPAGRRLATPWTSEERRATAHAVQAWWATHRHLGREALYQQVLLELPLGQLAAHLDQDPPRQALAVEAIARRLARPPSIGRFIHPWTLAELLEAVADHPICAAAVDGWTAEGEARPLMAVWRNRRGDPRPLDDLMEELTAQEADEDGLLETWLPVWLETPSPRRLLLLRSALELDPGRPTWRCWLAGLLRTDAHDSTRLAPPPTRPAGEGFHPTSLLRCCALETLLRDRRPLPDDLLLKDRGAWCFVPRPGSRHDFQHLTSSTAGEPSAPPRIRDLAYLLAERILQSSLERDERLNLTAPERARDPIIDAWRDSWREQLDAALEAAGLPPLPALPRGATDDGKLW